MYVSRFSLKPKFQKLGVYVSIYAKNYSNFHVVYHRSLSQPKSIKYYKNQPQKAQEKKEDNDDHLPNKDNLNKNLDSLLEAKTSIS